MNAQSKSKILGKNLSEYELNLYEYSTFSLTEEIDIFYCYNTMVNTISRNHEYLLYFKGHKMFKKLINCFNHSPYDEYKIKVNFNHWILDWQEFKSKTKNQT